MLEYYINSYLLRSLSKSKEKDFRINDVEKFNQERQTSANAIKASLNQEVEIVEPLDNPNLYTSTERLSNMMIKLLDENENSTNAYDDSFWISKILRNLGKLDNIEMMEYIARKVYR